MKQEVFYTMSSEMTKEEKIDLIRRQKEYYKYSIPEDKRIGEYVISLIEKDL